MTWVGLWSPQGGSYYPCGLDQPQRGVVDLDSVLPRGTLLLETALIPQDGPQVLVEYAATAPWLSGFRLSVDESGVLTLVHRMGAEVVTHQLATGHMGRADAVTIIYTWDAPARQGVLSVEFGETGQHCFTTLSGPLPLALRDAARMMTDSRSAQINDRVVYAALATHILPIGPLPSLAGQTLLATPTGMTPLAQIRAGQLVTLEDGSTAQVRWVGSQDLPAFGRFAPLKLHAPFYGAIRDVIGHADQRFHMRGSDVDYLFATQVVACELGHLTQGVWPLQPLAGRVRRYWQVVLDRPTPLRIGGLDVETLDVGRILTTPGLQRHSVLADVPGELLPNDTLTDVPVLRAFETRTLCHLRAA